MNKINDKALQAAAKDLHARESKREGTKPTISTCPTCLENSTIVIKTYLEYLDNN